MKQMITNLAKLLKVKTLVTIVVVAVWAKLAVGGQIDPGQVMTVVSMVIAFYFGTQHEKGGRE